MRKIKVTLTYNGNENFNNKLYETLKNLDEAIQEIDDLFIEEIIITPLYEDEQ